MGRKAKPTALRIIQGNTEHRPLPENEAHVEVVCPRAPRELTPRAKKHWPTVARRLSRAKLLGETDLDGLVAYCEAFGRWREAVDIIEREGMVIVPSKIIEEKPDGTIRTRLGAPIRNPAIAIMNKAFEQMTKLMTEFGMTPSSRTRAQVIGGKNSDADDGWGDA